MGDPWEDTLLPGPYLHTSSSSSFGPFRSDWSGCSEQLRYFTHSGPTWRSQNPPCQFRNPLIARVTGALRGCSIVFSLFLAKQLPPSAAFTQFRCHTKIKYRLLTCFPFPFLIQKAVTPINRSFCRLANKSIWLFIAYYNCNIYFTSILLHYYFTY